MLDKNNKYVAHINIQMTPEQLAQLVRLEVDRLLDHFKIEEKTKDLPDNMTRVEVAAFWNVTTSTVYNWEQEGLLKRVVIGGKTEVIRYAKAEVLNLEKNNNR